MCKHIKWTNKQRLKTTWLLATLQANCEESMQVDSTELPCSHLFNILIFMTTPQSLQIKK